EARCRDREDSRAAAVVDHALAAAQVLVEPLEAQARGRMAPGAEGETRIEHDRVPAVDRACGLRIDAVTRQVPGRRDPQAAADRDRRELRLRGLHPGLVGHVAAAEARGPGPPAGA